MLDSNAMNDVITWVVFFTTASVVVVAGSRLAAEGDKIGEETGIGGLWIGVILLATATSLPEVVTNISAAALDEADLAVGNLFGSSMANMAILAIIDMLYRQRRVWQAVSLGHTLVSSLGVALTAISAMFVVSELGWSLFHVGVDTVVIAALYMAGTRVVFRHEYLEALERIAERARARAENNDREADQEDERVRMPSMRSLAGFGVAALAIVAAAPFMADAASGISDQTGLERSFVGATFLAVVTSLPELVTAIAAVRIGAYDLAVGNLFGSNAFNMFTLFFSDIAYTSGPILEDVSSAEVVAALAALVMMSLATMGIVYRAERRYFMIEPDAALILLCYVLGLALVYDAGS